VPLPWAGDAPPYAFSPEGASGEPWLPQPDDWGPLSVAAQDADGDSMLALYREALRLRRELWVGAGDLDWVEAPEGVVAFRRGAGAGHLECWLNTDDEPVELPDGEVVLVSDPASTGRTLTGTAAAWLRR
jgi:alpha-glucosidase